MEKTIDNVFIYILCLCWKTIGNLTHNEVHKTIGKVYFILCSYRKTIENLTNNQVFMITFQVCENFILLKT